MIEINLSNESNQSFDYITENAKYTLTLRSTQYGVYVDVAVDDKLKITRVKALINTKLIPFTSIVNINDGNFLILGDPDSEIDSEKFNKTQFLVYLNKEQLKGFANANRT